MDEASPLLAAPILLTAFVYAAVGQAGGSGFLAVMALSGLAPAAIKPAALALNLVAAALVSWQCWRAGLIGARPLLPLLAGALPLAALGGALDLPPGPYRLIAGASLLLAAIALLRPAHPTAQPAARTRPLPATHALPLGAAIGLLSGLTGIGGGIYLAPVLLFGGWAGMRDLAGITAPFILAVSAAAFAAHAATPPALPAALASLLPLLALAAAAGALAGARFGHARLSPRAARVLLAALLALAALRLLAEAILA